MGDSFTPSQISSTLQSDFFCILAKLMKNSSIRVRTARK